LPANIKAAPVATVFIAARRDSIVIFSSFVFSLNWLPTAL
jgi:hypothetical protein